MKLIITALAMVLGTFVHSFGQVFKMNTLERTQGSVLKSQSDRIPYQLNTQIFEENLVTQGAMIQVEIPSGMQNLTVIRISEFVKGIKSYRAVSSDGQIFSFTYSNNKLVGSYFNTPKNSYDFLSEKGSEQAYITLSIQSPFYCGQDEI